jgi:hypothetical protein
VIEIRIGKLCFPVVAVGSCDDGDIVIVFAFNGSMWGQSARTGQLAPLKFNKGKTTWGGKVVKFVV